MLKDSTRETIAIEIMTSLRDDQAVKTVKAGKEIFHQDWTDEDINIMCSYIKEHKTLDWAGETWPNNTDQIYKQIHLFALKATDFQLALWLEKIWGDGEKALKYIMTCEQKLN